MPGGRSHYGKRVRARRRNEEPGPVLSVSEGNDYLEVWRINSRRRSTNVIRRPESSTISSLIQDGAGDARAGVTHQRSPCCSTAYHCLSGLRPPDRAVEDAFRIFPAHHHSRASDAPSGIRRKIDPQRQAECKVKPDAGCDCDSGHVHFPVPRSYAPVSVCRTTQRMEIGP